MEKSHIKSWLKLYMLNVDTNQANPNLKYKKEY